MGPNYSILLRDIHLGMPTSKEWRPMVHGVITWFSMVRQTALIPAFTWSAVVIMMYWLTHNVKMSTVTGLYWDTYASFTMLALFHANHLKVIHLLPCNVRFKKTLQQIEVVVVLKWQYVMSNFCRLSEVLVLVPRVTCKNDDIHLFSNNLCRRNISTAFRALLLKLMILFSSTSPKIEQK